MKLVARGRERRIIVILLLLLPVGGDVARVKRSVPVVIVEHRDEAAERGATELTVTNNCN